MPYPLNKPPLLPTNDRVKHKAKVILASTDGFSTFKIQRSSDDNTLFDTSFGGFIFR